MAAQKKAQKSTTKRKKRRNRQKRYDMSRLWMALGLLALVLLVIFGVTRHQKKVATASSDSFVTLSEIDKNKPDLDVELLTVNPYSRPGSVLEKVNGIVIHYTANPGATAIANRNYFENLKDTHTTKASSHFVVGLEGEIVQCIPTAEIAYASNDRNSDTISIECCYKNEDGSFEQATYDSVIKLTAWLCAKFGLTSENVIRHYDVTGKLCPLYYVEHEDAWTQFKKDVDSYLQVYETGDENG
ncbi:N-acetylmuramoyl-L-alanine amidase family protein [uncultured Eubacterium sp.]|uniref:peptidoglycan recognition protein family protein n=1 Tax=uncultured Eubacterium sp. TaxID=165185 RepID=UPI0025DB4BA7|nr:peptidoglycan recognition family protein [uncultured Eubacterium sp.]